MYISIHHEKLGLQLTYWDDDKFYVKAVGIAMLSYGAARGSAIRLRHRLTLPSVFKAATAPSLALTTDTLLDRELETWDESPPLEVDPHVVTYMYKSIQHEKLGLQLTYWDDDNFYVKATGIAMLSYGAARGSAMRLRHRLTLPSVFKAAKA